MSDRRRSEDYKQVSGYIPIDLAREFKSLCAREGISQSDALEEMTREWIARINGSAAVAKPIPMETIADVVTANIAKLKRCGVKNLQAIAKGEVLPTPGDFAIITSALGIAEEERKNIWQKTFKISVFSDSGSVNVYNDSGSIKGYEHRYS
jgi:Ribbon-helix-helix protein, copG family